MTSATGPISTMRPAYITATRSAVSAITPMSCVISMTAVPCSRHSRFRSSMICAWIDTSSAVVGSSAMMSRGLRRERERDHDALAHAAGELVRIVIEAARRGGNAHFVEQLDRARLRLAAPTAADACAIVSTSWRADRVQRIERGQRILEDRADLAAADRAHRFVRQIVDAPAGEPDLAAGDASGRIDEADDRGAGHRLSGAGLADDAQHLARRDVERDVVHRAQRAVARRELDAKADDREQRFQQRDWSAPCVRPRHRNFGLSASRIQSPSRLIASTMITSAAPGKIVIHHSPENRKSLPTRISVPSDGCVGGTPTPRNDSVASVMIAVAMLIVASTSTGPSTLGSRWRRMMPSGEMPITRAAWTYSLFFSTIVEPRTVRAYWTQLAAPIAKISTKSATFAMRVARQHRAGDAVDQQRDQDRRKRELDVGDAHDEGVELAAGVAGDETERDAEHDRERDRREPDQERDARAEHDRGKHVATLVVGAEQVARLRSRACHAGGASASSRLSVRRSNGLCGATHGANSAAARQMASTMAETIATGDVRKLQAMSLFHAHGAARVRADRRRSKTSARSRIVHAQLSRTAATARVERRVARLRVDLRLSSRRSRRRTRRASAGGSPRRRAAGAAG